MRAVAFRGNSPRAIFSVLPVIQLHESVFLVPILDGLLGLSIAPRRRGAATMRMGGYWFIEVFLSPHCEGLTSTRSRRGGHEQKSLDKYIHDVYESGSCVWSYETYRCCRFIDK